MKSADELAAMNDAQLETYFAPYIKFSRPDPARAKVISNKAKVFVTTGKKNKEKDMISNICRALNLPGIIKP